MAASICREHKDVVLRRSRVYKIMQVVLLAKFSGSEDRKAQLMATHRLCLVEGNDWNDTFWGKRNGRGVNALNHEWNLRQVEPSDRHA